MHARLLRAAFQGVLFALPLGMACGHGGKYQGPTDTVPPNQKGSGGDTPPPTNPGDTGVPTLPGTPGGTGKGGAPTTPGGTPTAKGGGGYCKRPPGQSGRFEQWEFWWEANDDAFLALRQRMRREASTATSSYFGRGHQAQGGSVSRLDGADLARVRAALIGALASDEGDLVDSAAIALARMTAADGANDVIAALKPVLRHREKSAREAATLALGITGSLDAAPLLRELLLDTPAGREATGQATEVESMVRAFAAAALGLVGDSTGADDLMRVVTDASLRAGRDVKSTALRALGMLRGRTEERVAFLQRQIDDPAQDRVVRAQAPLALAHAAEQGDGAAARAALPMLVERLLSDKTDLDLLRSCAVALGRIATIEDAEVVDALGRSSARAGDEQTRHFALMALAEISRRDADPAAHQELQRSLQQRFLRELLQAKPITGTPWGALALGVFARNPRVDKDLLAQAQDKLAEELEGLANPSFRAATAVALGLADAKESRGVLMDLLETEKNQILKSYVAIGLGLMDAREAAAPLRAVMKAKGLDPMLRIQVARALGLLGDREAVAALVENLQVADTLGETSATAQALGLIGDREAVDPLLAILGDERQPSLRRGFAAVGLGLLAEKGDLPWNAPFTVGSNYRAKTPALAEIFDIL
jgi:HEAT repeat protein